MPDTEEGRGGVAAGGSEHLAPTAVRPVSCTHSPRDDRSYPTPTILGKHLSGEDSRKIQPAQTLTSVHGRPMWDSSQVEWERGGADQGSGAD